VGFMCNGVAWQSEANGSAFTVNRAVSKQASFIELVHPHGLYS
jgi:hypothetical protein